MDTIRLLSNYRKAVTRDRNAMHVLAFLHRDGPLDETVLAEKTSQSIAETCLKLTELYRANLVLLLGDSRYATTTLAEQILAETAIPDIVANAAIEEAPILSDDRSFLRSCIDRSSDDSPAFRRYLRTSVRLAALLGRVKGDPYTSTVLLYGAAAGLNPSVHELGADTFSRHIFTSWADSQHGDARLKHYVFQCKQAVDLRRASNQFMSHGDVAWGEDADAVLGLTFMRLFAGVVTHNFDDGLVAALDTTGFNNDAVERLSEWASQLRSYVEQLPWGGFPHDDAVADDPIRFLLMRVQRELRQSRLSAVDADLSLSSDLSRGVLDLLREVERQIGLSDLTRPEVAEAEALLSRILDALKNLSVSAATTSRAKELA